MNNYEKNGVERLKALVSLTAEEIVAVEDATETYDTIDTLDSIRTYKEMVAKWLRDDIKSFNILKDSDVTVESIETFKFYSEQINTLTNLFKTLDSVIKKVERVGNLAKAEAEAEISRIEDAL